MNVAVRILVAFLLAYATALAAQEQAASAVPPEPIPGTYEECFHEPIFEGKVCTVQANRDARVGVILIHGLGGSTDDWKNTIPALAKDFHVLAFDLPGFGKSDKGSQEYSPTRYARLAHFLADRYFPNKDYHIVGHSMGGAIALRFAAQRPLRFQRLVLIDAAGILHPQVISKFQAGSMLERTSGVKQTRGFAERLSGKLLEQVDKLPISPIDIANSALGRDQVLQGGPEKIAALELAGEDFSYAVTSVNEPTLILWGDSDLTVPLRTGKVLAARMPYARLEIIADAGHEPMQDQIEQTNTLVRKHLLTGEHSLTEQFQPLPAKPAMTSKREGICKNDSGMTFEGDYRSIDLRDCSNVTIRNARIGHLHVYNSRATLTDTDILGKEEGVYAEYADLTVTNGDISGDTAIHAKYSRLDLAGVHLKGNKDAVKAYGSKVVFSISEIHSPHTNGAMHAYKQMDDGVL
ncbi:MAG: alpha/beta hydrolase [Nitrosomonadales bacterium]|nr:alpha/beta hydrolase [Nitrosomonadales bacterium]